MFLTAAQLQDLTGLKLPNAQARWLRENGFEFATRADGKIRVLVAHVEIKLGGRVESQNHKDMEPDWEAIGAA